MNIFSSKRFTGFVFAAVCSFLSLEAEARLEKCTAQSMAGVKTFSGTVSALSDGDTLRVRVGEDRERTIRLMYMDTPETHYMGETQGEAGELASKALAAAAPLGTNVTVVLEGLACDRYGRYLGIVFSGSVEVNLFMVQNGFAAPLCFGPNLTQCGRYIAAGKFSRDQNPENVFNKYKIEYPHEFRSRISGKPEATFVGNWSSPGAVLRGTDLMKISDPLDRIFFNALKDLKAPFSAPVEQAE
jgi:micrococcal nuclease